MKDVKVYRFTKGVQIGNIIFGEPVVKIPLCSSFVVLTLLTYF